MWPRYLTLVATSEIDSVGTVQSSKRQAGTLLLNAVGRRQQTTVWVPIQSFWMPCIVQRKDCLPLPESLSSYGGKMLPTLRPSECLPHA